MLANVANAFTVTTTKTVSDGFGARVTKSQTFSNNGSRRCRSVTQTATDAFGDRRSRTITQCASDF
jgi:hypothetical protein